MPPDPPSLTHALHMIPTCPTNNLYNLISPPLGKKLKETLKNECQFVRHVLYVNVDFCKRHNQELVNYIVRIRLVRTNFRPNP